MNKKKLHDVFLEGPITPDFIAASISKHSSKTDIGAHQIFLGQVRNDEISGKMVQSIEYSAYTDLALTKMSGIREDIFAAYGLTCLHVYHSLGEVRAGEICLFVFASSSHRYAATAACAAVVERIKNELPIWGKEIFEDSTYQWKENS